MIRRTAGPATIALGLACAPMAQATPPDQIIVNDELIGIGHGHVFVLRQSLDNLGLHNSDMRNLALVAIDRATAEEQIWPVMRSHRLPDYDKDPDGLLMKIEPLPLPDAIDPFAKLAEMGGYPILGPSVFGSPDLGMAPNIGSNLETLGGFTTEDGTRFTPDVAALRASTSQSLDQFSAAMGDYPRFGPLNAGDLLMGQDFSETPCTFTDRSLIWGGEAPTHLVRVTCPKPALPEADGSDSVAASMWKVVPPDAAK